MEFELPIIQPETEETPFTSTIDHYRRPELPEIFADQLTQTATFITALDQDPDRALEDPQIRQWLKELGNSTFVRIAAPSLALPPWLHQDFLTNHNLFERFSARTSNPRWRFSSGPKPSDPLDETFREFASQFTRYGASDEYYIINDSISPTPRPRNFKLYIKGEAFTQILESGLIEQMFEQLDLVGVPVNEMKKYEGNQLTLYFFQDIGQAEIACQAINNLHIPFRGPAQDVYSVIKNGSGLTLKVDTSNDGGLGDANHSQVKYTLDHYSPSALLDNLARLCLFAGKNPANPYRTSFVYAIDKDMGDQAELLPDNSPESVLAGYPTVRTGWRLTS